MNGLSSGRLSTDFSKAPVLSQSSSTSLSSSGKFTCGLAFSNAIPHSSHTQKLPSSTTAGTGAPDSRGTTRLARNLAAPDLFAGAPKTPLRCNGRTRPILLTPGPRPFALGRRLGEDLRAASRAGLLTAPGSLPRDCATVLVPFV